MQGVATGESALAALAAAAERAAVDPAGADALAALAAAAAQCSGVGVAVVRVPGGPGLLFAEAVAGQAELAAELEGSTIPAAEAEAAVSGEPDDLPPGIRALAARVGARDVVVAPAYARGILAGSVELYGARLSPPGDERLARDGPAVARLLAAQLALLQHRSIAPVSLSQPAAVELVAEALAAASADGRSAARLARVAATATGATSGLLWAGSDGEPELLGAAGEPPEGAHPPAFSELEGRAPVTVDQGGAGWLVTVRLGTPALGVLQLVFGAEPDPGTLSSLGALAAAAAQTLRAGERTRGVRLELDRTRALLAVVAQAISQLSLAHTLETAVEQVAELLAVDSVAVYLRDGPVLVAAASRSVDGPHSVVAERLLELALGPFRARGMVAATDAADDRRLVTVREALLASDIGAVHAVLLLAHEDVIGLLAVYPPSGTALDDGAASLLAALASQLAVAVQNASLHEETKALGADRERALQAERAAARRLEALYEISRSFAQSLSLEATLEAVVQKVVELLGADAAVLRIPDERGELLVAERLHVRDDQLEPALRTMLSGPQQLSRLPMRRLRSGSPVLLDAPTARSIGGSDALLVSFLEQGCTAAILPIATPGEVLATVTVVSLDPSRPLTAELLDTARTLAAQAALALDNARLYQHQKRFTDAMQRSLLPRERPDVPGLELGEAYESSARLDVGGDVYDYLVLGEGLLAVVVGDVTGHGVDAAADMAMAKFVFRSLAREHPEPGAFLAHANEIVCEEVAPGKFITMLYLVADVERQEVAVASAGHPPPRLVLPDGTAEPLRARGLVLGIEGSQEYEELRRPFLPGSVLILYTDGVVESRRGEELYGEERLDQFVTERAGLPARELAAAVLDDCRRFGGGELRDDCAVVVLKHLA